MTFSPKSSHFVENAFLRKRFRIQIPGGGTPSARFFLLLEREFFVWVKREREASYAEKILMVGGFCRDVKVEFVLVEQRKCEGVRSFLSFSALNGFSLHQCL